MLDRCIDGYIPLGPNSENIYKPSLSHHPNSQPSRTFDLLESVDMTRHERRASTPRTETSWSCRPAAYPAAPNVLIEAYTGTQRRCSIFWDIFPLDFEEHPHLNPTRGASTQSDRGVAREVSAPRAPPPLHTANSSQDVHNGTYNRFARPCAHGSGIISSLLYVRQTGHKNN